MTKVEIEDRNYYQAHAMVTWAEENTPSFASHDITINQFTFTHIRRFYFNAEEDAMWFVLRWL